MSNHIDTASVSRRLRDLVLDVPNKKVLLSRIAGSEQALDLSEPANCNGFGRIRHFHYSTSANWPRNPLPIIPACNKLGVESRKDMNAQVFQLAGCMWRCWYCFVPYNLLAADSSVSGWFTPDEMIEMYLSVSNRPSIIDLSGGSPDLSPEWILWIMEALERAGQSLEVYLWSDDNLSTEYLFEMLTPQQIRLMSEYRNYGRVCCFKGFDKESFAFNTNAASEDFDRQFQIMRRLLKETSFDLYGYVTLTTNTDDNLKGEMANFVDRLQALSRNLPLRVVPLEIRAFTPTKARMTVDRERALAIQQDAISMWNQELASRYSTEELGKPIYEIELR